MDRSQVKVIAVDFCGTLCKEDCYTEEEIRNATPIQETIDNVNKLSRTNFIVIYTARRNHLITASIEWLDSHGVIWHAISNKKMPADIYCDDRAVRPNELGKLNRRNKNDRKSDI